MKDVFEGIVAARRDDRLAIEQANLMWSPSFEVTRTRGTLEERKIWRWTVGAYQRLYTPLSSSEGDISTELIYPARRTDDPITLYVDDWKYGLVICADPEVKILRNSRGPHGERLYDYYNASFENVLSYLSTLNRILKHYGLDEVPNIGAPKETTQV